MCMCCLAKSLPPYVTQTLNCDRSPISNPGRSSFFIQLYPCSLYSTIPSEVLNTPFLIQWTHTSVRAPLGQVPFTLHHSRDIYYQAPSISCVPYWKIERRLGMRPWQKRVTRQSTRPIFILVSLRLLFYLNCSRSKPMTKSSQLWQLSVDWIWDSGGLSIPLGSEKL